MDKIHIQFKESDYKIYLGYCSRYYESHDTLRRQSIQAFLDLYERGVLPVEAQDIEKARTILSIRCDDLRRSSPGTKGSGDATGVSQVRACSDLLAFCEDLEKLFRLLSKQPTGANYLMILATFVRILEENKESNTQETYHLDDEVIEALAQPLSDCIWERIGPDRHWRSVLRELTFIAARFNHLHSELRLDLDVATIVAPSVIARFYKDVDAREILSALPAIFEESDLEEFEAFLDQAPGPSSPVKSSDIDWDPIIPPLRALTAAMAGQQRHGSQDIFGAPGTSSPLSANDISHKGASSLSTPPVSSMTESSAVGIKRFDITVSPDLTHSESAPSITRDAPGIAKVSPYGSLATYSIKPYMPAIIGVAVIIIFILGTLMITSGGNLHGGGNSTGWGMSGEGNSTGWNILGGGNSTGWNIFGFWNSTNSTTTLNKSSTPTKTTVKAVTTTAKATAKPTAKPTATKTVAPTTTAPKAYSSTDVGNHLLEIAFGPNNNKIEIPKKDLYALSITGTTQNGDVPLVKTFIDQFDTYSTTLKLSTNLEESGVADITIVFLPQASLEQINPPAGSVIYQEGGGKTIYFIRSDEKTYVNSDLQGNTRSRWLLRAILCNLGFFGESSKYSDSLFYSNVNNVAKLSDIDWKAVQLMYGTKITNGMTKSAVKAVI
ncbi:MAG TPA: hypothetical protein PLM60_10860 [Methanoregulaceae archaeon]|nr:hypothetical protein [Methanoregulaceae archaeon]